MITQTGRKNNKLPASFGRKFWGGGREDVYDWLREALEQEFEVVRPLKEGPRGTIRLLRHRETGRRFVLRQYAGSAEVYRRLRDVQCEHLPQVYEVATRGEDNLVLEEYVQGDTLDCVLRGGLCSPRETRRIARQVCQALWVLHSLGAVHRDVKPENILLRGREAVLIDFDAARLHKPAQDTDTQVLGTTGFAAPEQYGLSQTDGRADIYAMGILINVMRTGQHPSRKLAPGHLGRVVERCTQMMPQKRYPNVLRLMEAL